MRLRSVISPVVSVAVLGGLAYAGYRTRDRWAPYVFPPKTAATSGDARDHGEGHDEHAGHDHDHGTRDDRVKLTPQAQKNLGLDVDTPIPEEYWRKILIPGVVVDRPGESDRRVTSRAPGVVARIMARPGDTIKVGDPLFTIQLVSEFVQGTQTDLAKAAKEVEFARIKLEQTKKLVATGTKPEIFQLEEENALKRLVTQVQGYRRQLVLFGLTPEQVDRAEKGEVVTEVTVSARPQAADPAEPKSSADPARRPEDVLYEIQELKVQLNEQVQAGQTLATLADHQHLFVEGLAFKSEAKALAVAAAKGVPIRAAFSEETPGDWPEQVPLVIHHLSNQVDPTTRTFAFYMALENRAETFTRNGKVHYVWRYRPGQRVRLWVPVEKLVTHSPDGEREVLPFVLPAGAVVREGPEAFVFVQSGDVFVRKPVHVLYEDRNEVVVANDGSVTEADFVVRNQAAAINRALKAAAAGGAADAHAGHSHDH
jgi:multidrug efflux pump subunit AcrA (membrane-fusion protein)